MFKWMRESLNKDEGFTLVELMVVVLIIAILIAIAIPTFLGARERAQDRAAQSNLRNALTAEKVFYTDAEEYTAAAANLTAIEPSLGFAAAPDATDPNVVGVTICNSLDSAAALVSVNGAVNLQVISASGTTWTLEDVATGDMAGTYYFNAASACSGDGGGGATDGFPPAP